MGTATKLGSIIENEEHALSAKGGYVPDRKYNKIINIVLGPGEHVIIGARQSYLETLSPGIVLATNKRVLIIKLSFWSLYIGYNLMRPSLFINIHYNRITEISMSNGILHCSLMVRVFGGGDIRFDGLRRREAVRLVGFLERISVANEESGAESGLQ